MSLPQTRTKLAKYVGKGDSESEQRNENKADIKYIYTYLIFILYSALMNILSKFWENIEG